MILFYAKGEVIKKYVNFQFLCSAKSTGLPLSPLTRLRMSSQMLDRPRSSPEEEARKMKQMT
jgi:hypothetical protein